MSARISASLGGIIASCDECRWTVGGATRRVLEAAGEHDRDEHGITARRPSVPPRLSIRTALEALEAVPFALDQLEEDGIANDVVAAVRMLQSAERRLRARGIV